MAALRKFPNPDISKADRRGRIAVRLQLDRCAIVGPIFGLSDVERFTGQLKVVLEQKS